VAGAYSAVVVILGCLLVLVSTIMLWPKVIHH